MTTPIERVVLRMAGADDAGRLHRLAALDSVPLPSGATLLAEVEGELVAALSLADRARIGDPFRPTRAILDLLELRADQLEASEGAQSGPGKLRECQKATRSTAPQPV
jgi:hypothetical protein